MDERTTDDRLTLLRAIVAVARADGRIDDRERRRIRELSAFLRLGDDQRDEVERLLGDDVPPPELPDPSALPAYEVRLYVFQQALGMSYADGEVHADERGLLDALAEALLLRDDDVQIAWRRAAELAED
ncbi:MAG: DUF533 domain-containing protein [Myxococcota bacterium]